MFLGITTQAGGLFRKARILRPQQDYLASFCHHTIMRYCFYIQYYLLAKMKLKGRIKHLLANPIFRS